MSDDEGNDENRYGLHPDEEMQPQTERLRKWQVENSAGGFSFKVTDMERLLRFIILGTESGTFYCPDSKELTRENVSSIDRLIIQDRGREVVDAIRMVSVTGRACKQNSTIYALAICARSNDPDAKEAAYAALSDVCRIPTDLFTFIKYCQDFSAGTGWGRAHRRAISNWYNNFKDDVKRLAYLVTKFRKRQDWEHKDVVRLAHITPASEPLRLVIMYLVKGLTEAKRLRPPVDTEDLKKWQEVIVYLEAVEQGFLCTEEDEMVKLINSHKLVREHVPTPLLKSVKVWQALLRDMPLNALVRNLGKMGSLQMMSEGSDEENLVLRRLTDVEQLRKARIHPFKVLIALNIYRSGKGEQGKLTWPRNQKIIDALDRAYDLCFVNVRPTNKKYCLAIDVSGSMETPILGTPSVTAKDGAAAMMMVTARTEPDFEVYAFCHDLHKLYITKKDSLKTVHEKTHHLPFGATDCSKPITYAIEKKKRFDVFIVYTDSETYYGNTHPSKALQNYRTVTGIKDARLIVVAMTSNGFTIADPADKFMLDVVGFDSNAPEAMRSFVEGYGLDPSK